MSSVTFLRCDPVGRAPLAVLVLAHGAGAPADSAFMNSLATALAEAGIASLRFEFPYMAKRRLDGRRRPPDRQPVLLDCFRQAVDSVADSTPGQRLFIGGKSMGGRMASHMVSGPGVHPAICGAVCFGYPFHPPGKLDRWRTEHLSELNCPLQIIQGSRDPFGRRAEVVEQAPDSLSKLELAWLEGGDHDFRPLARQPRSQVELITEAAALAADFMHRWNGKNRCNN